MQIPRALFHLATGTLIAGLAACTAIFDPDRVTYGDDGGTGTDSGRGDAGGGDAGSDAGSDAGFDAGDACSASAEVCDGRDNDCDGRIDEGVPQLGCRVDGDGDGFSPPDSDVVMACVCPDGRSETPADMFDCGDTTPDAFPGQTAYFVARFRKRIGSLTVNSFDYDCDGTEDLRPLVGAQCRIGLIGSCPAEEGPWAYDPATTQCDDLVEFARCETNCTSMIVGMVQVGCH